MINILKLWKNKVEGKKEIRYFSDILINEPPNSWGNWDLDVLDYTENPNQLLIDRDKFIQESQKPIIKVRGYVAGLITKMFNSSLDASLTYGGFIILGNDDNKFPLYFCNYRTYKENKNLHLEESVLKAGKDFPLTITGTFFPKFENNRYPYSLSPHVLQIGDYICPYPEKKSD